MLLGDADIMIAFRHFFGETDQARAFTHCGRYRMQFRILLSLGDQPVGKDAGIGLHARFARGFQIAGCGIERTDAMKLAGIFFRRGIALSFARDDVQHARSGQLLQIAYQGE